MCFPPYVIRDLRSDSPYSVTERFAPTRYSLSSSISLQSQLQARHHQPSRTVKEGFVNAVVLSFGRHIKLENVAASP